MKQIVQPLAGGPVEVLDVPRPVPDATEVLVRTVASVISPGTERAVTALAQSSLLAKARARPDLVRQVVRKARTDGLSATRQVVRSRLAQDLPLGYSAAGVVLATGSAVSGVRAGQLVATGGAGKASHAEFQAVPGLLCATVPGRRARGGRGVHDDRLHRAARAAPGRGRARVEGAGAGAGTDRAAGRPARHGVGVFGDRDRPGRIPAAGRGGLRGAGPGRMRRGHHRSGAGLVPRPGSGRGASLRGGPVVGRHHAGARAVPGPGHRGRRRRRRPEPGPHPVLSSGSCRCGSPDPTAPAATSRRTRPGAWTSRLGRCAGPKAGTSRPCST